MHYYQFNIGDYASHTGYLTHMEDLGLRRLMDLYYLQEKPLTNDVPHLCRVVGMREFEAEITQVLTDFFYLDADVWRNKRVDKEIDSYRAKADTARANGALGGRPKGTTKPKITQPVSVANPEITGSKANHKPLTINQEPVKDTRKRFIPPSTNEVYGYMVEKGLVNGSAKEQSEKLHDYYSANGWKVGRNPMKDWKAATRNWLKGVNGNQPAQQQVLVR